MELVIPERVLFETEVYEVEEDLRVKKGLVKITENRILFKGNGDLKLVYITGIKMLSIKKEDRWGYLIAGALFLMSSVLMYALGMWFGIGDFTSAIVFFVFPTLFLLLGLILTYWWYVTRSYLLEMFTDFGRDVKIRSNCREDLVEIANAVELVKMGAVRMLQKRSKSFA